jgi:hypothetical protein
LIAVQIHHSSTDGSATGMLDDEPGIRILPVDLERY